MGKKLDYYRLKKGLLYLKHYGVKAFWVRIKERLQTSDMEYESWYQWQQLTEEEKRRQEKAVFKYQPLISVIVPVYNTPELYLREMLDSVLNQTYQNWELCIANASPLNQSVKNVLNEYFERDTRVKVINVQENKGIAQNTNEALSVASGEYVGFLDHDDLLTADALYEVVAQFNQNEKTELVYSDEDKVSADLSKFYQPHMKPEFNLDLLRSNNYICHFCVIKKALVDACGGLKEEFDGAQDYDLILRCVEKTEKIARIPRVLYHWRVHSSSTSDNPISKMYAYDAGQRAIEEHLKRCGEKASVYKEKDLGFYRVTYDVQDNPMISIIIPKRDCTEVLERCLRSIQASTYENYEVIIVEEGHSYSAMNNDGAARAKGEYLLFLHPDVEVISPDWLEELVANCQRAQVGIVGAKLYYPDNTVQHAGMIVGMGGIADNVFTGLPREYSGYLHKASMQQDLSAVSGACMMVKRSVYESVGGFTEELEERFYDVDFCLKVRQMDKLVVYHPYVELYHYETKTRRAKDLEEKKFSDEIEYMKKHWKEILQTGDPMYNPNFSLQTGNYALKTDKG